MSGHRQGPKIVAALDGLNSFDTARRYVGQTISIAADELPKLAPGEFYWAQLQGLEAVTESGARLGVVDHLFETGANDVMVIRQDQKEFLVPYVPDVVCRVDLEEGRIELNWEMDA